MPSEPKFTAGISRQVRPYVTIWNAAKAMLPPPGEKPDRHHCLAIGVLTAFALEGYLNHAGVVLFENWNDSLERELRTTDEKLRHIAKELKMEIDRSTRPFQLMRTIFTFRDSIAHAKTTESTQAKAGKGLPVRIAIGDAPTADWERQCEPTTVLRWLEAAEQMIKRLHSELLKHPKASDSENADPFATGARGHVRVTISLTD